MPTIRPPASSVPSTNELLVGNTQLLVDMPSMSYSRQRYSATIPVRGDRRHSNPAANTGTVSAAPLDRMRELLLTGTLMPPADAVPSNTTEEIPTSR